LFHYVYSFHRSEKVFHLTAVRRSGYDQATGKGRENGSERTGKMDDLEPMNGPYDWAEAVRQNPGTDITELPDAAEDALADALANETEQWLAFIADVDG
jgi:hypothetical protein